VDKVSDTTRGLVRQNRFLPSSRELLFRGGEVVFAGVAAILLVTAFTVFLGDSDGRWAGLSVLTVILFIVEAFHRRLLTFGGDTRISEIVWQASETSPTLHVSRGLVAVALLVVTLAGLVLVSTGIVVRDRPTHTKPTTVGPATTADSRLIESKLGPTYGQKTAMCGFFGGKYDVVVFPREPEGSTGAIEAVGCRNGLSKATGVVIGGPAAATVSASDPLKSIDVAKTPVVRHVDFGSPVRISSERPTTLFTWDGLRDDGSRAAPGIYIAQISIGGLFPLSSPQSGAIVFRLTAP
jgi:hypothetical protein